MLREGWQPGTGLGLDSTGITQPVIPATQLTRQAIGYRGHTQDTSKRSPAQRYKQPLPFVSAGVQVTALMTHIHQEDQQQSPESDSTLKGVSRSPKESNQLLDSSSTLCTNNPPSYHQMEIHRIAMATDAHTPSQ